MSSVLWYNQGSGIFPDSVSGRCVRLKKAFVFLSALVFLSCLYSGVSADSVPVIVSLGDSYSCGEGIEPFYGQDAEMALRCLDPDWLAHRSEKSWPGMLTLPGVSGPMKEHRGENWFFAAASGADSYALSGHKIHAPKGIGALIMGPRSRLTARCPRSPSICS